MTAQARITVPPPDPRIAHLDEAVALIEREGVRLDLHQRIAVARIIDQFAYDHRDREPWQW